MVKKLRWNSPEALGLAAITLLGLLLRLKGLGQASLWYDEVITVAAARSPWKDFPVMVRDWFLSPPWDYLLMRPFVLVGEGEALARSWACIAGTLSIPLMHAWVRAWAGPAAALLAALLLATSAFAVDYSQEARMYASFLLFTLLSFVALQRLLRAPDKTRAALYGATLPMIMLSHYFGVWVALLQAPWLLLELRRNGGWPRALGLAGLAWALGAALFTPWLPSFLFQLKTSQGAVPWGMPFDLASFTTLLKLYSSGRSTAWAFGAAFVFAAVQAHRQGRRELAAAAWMAVGALALPLAASHFKPNVSPRYLIYFLAPYYAVVAAGIAMLALRFRYGLVLAVALILGGLVPAVLRNQAMGINAFKPRWRDAALHINADPRPAPVAADAWTSKIVLGFYLRPYENHFWPQLSEPKPPEAYRLVVADEALVGQIEAGRWQGWVVVHFGVNQPGGFEPLAARIRAAVVAPVLHLPSPNESNGVDVYDCRGPIISAKKSPEPTHR